MPGPEKKANVISPRKTMNSNVGLPALSMLWSTNSPPNPTSRMASEPMRTPTSHFFDRI
jgi:hypothetical protein